VLKEKNNQDIRIVNTYAPNVRAPTLVKQTLLNMKAERVQYISSG
jgi:hypothetical protein